MNGSKRSSFSSKSGKFSGKLKDSISVSHQRPEPKVADIKDFSKIPIIKQSENELELRKYTEFLSRTPGEPVPMDDLDKLRQDLEKLLCTNAIRTRFFLGEKKDGNHSKNSLRIVKRNPSRFYNEYEDIPKPRNENSDKFWASIELYCAPVNKDHIAFVDTLLDEVSKKIDMKIPELGEHYINPKAEDIFNSENYLDKSVTKKPGLDFKKNGLHEIEDPFGSQFSQNLLPSLINDKSNKKPFITNGENASAFPRLRHNGGRKLGSCLDKNLLKELVNQGILSQEDVDTHVPEDVILREIEKCQQELITVNEYNLEELNKVRSAMINDILCTPLKSELEKVDKEVLELYNNILTTREKVLQDDTKDYDSIFSETAIKEFEGKANGLLRKQHLLTQQINSRTDMSMLY